VALLFLPELLQARADGNVALGIAYGLGATVIASAGNIAAVRNQRAGIPVLPGTAWGMGYGALVAALAAIAHGAPWTFDLGLPYVASLLYLSLFGSVIAFGSYLTLIKNVGPGPSSYVNIAIPVVALVFSTLFEGYRWTWVSALGVALAVAANWMALRPPASRAARRADAT
jgi:drug/metabolite transporter (DMT)-like permease